MKIEINEQAKAKLINEWFCKSVDDIRANAETGIDTTDLYIPKEIAGEVRERLEKEIENIMFLVVRRGNNEYTGRPESYTGEVIGNDRHYKTMLR